MCISDENLSLSDAMARGFTKDDLSEYSAKNGKSGNGRSVCPVHVLRACVHVSVFLCISVSMCRSLCFALCVCHGLFSVSIRALPGVRVCACVCLCVCACVVLVLVVF